VFVTKESFLNTMMQAAWLSVMRAFAARGLLLLCRVFAVPSFFFQRLPARTAKNPSGFPDGFFAPCISSRT